MSSLHPLDPLTPDEINAAAAAIKLYALQYPGGQDTKSDGNGIKAVKFLSITLLEPTDKVTLLKYLQIPISPIPFGQPPPIPGKEEIIIPRRVYSTLLDPITGRGYECTLTFPPSSSSKAPTVDTFTPIPSYIHPSISVAELLAAETLIKASPVIPPLLAPLGLTIDDVFCDGWSIGYDKRFPQEMRIQQCLLFARPHGPDSNLYAHPLDFLPVVDVNKGDVLRVDWLKPRSKEEQDTKPTDKDESPPAHRSYYPTTASEYLPSTLKATTPNFALRTDLKPINISQPLGPSFTLDGHQLTWGKFDMHIGFNYREGLVINTVTYTDTDLGPTATPTTRPLVYRMSIAEMVVPYGDPNFPHHRKMAFDVGEYGLGMMVNSLKLGCDCKGHITYLPVHLPSPAAPFTGDSLEIPNAICIHEEDYGLGWKHTDYRTGLAHTVRMRRLTVSCICTLANYEYGFYFHFYLDGSIQCEVKLTGILNTTFLPEGETPGGFGTEVSPGVNAHYHQHIFCLRVDPMIDGLYDNAIVETDVVPVSKLGMERGSKGNHIGNGFTTKKSFLNVTSVPTTNGKANGIVHTIAKGKKAGWADWDYSSGRSWTIVNQSPERKHWASGEQAGYKIVCKDFTPLFASSSSGPGTEEPTGEESIVEKRAPFAKHHLWYLPTEFDKKYPAGLHVPQSQSAVDGIFDWIDTANSSVSPNGSENSAADLTTYITFTATHIPRPEDFPVMPVESVGVTLKPVSFFRRNPMLDVPSELDIASGAHGHGTNEVKEEGATLFTEGAHRSATEAHVHDPSANTG